jgi:Uncharacterised protein family (UPF0175)
MNKNDVAMLIASQLYEQGKLSLGQAAKVAGLTKRTFAGLPGKYNVSIFNYLQMHKTIISDRSCLQSLLCAGMAIGTQKAHHHFT